MNYIRETLPEILIVEHTQLRKPGIMVFAYQGDHTLWGYAEIEGWEDPTPSHATEGVEWGGAKFRRVYKIKQCSIKEFGTYYSFITDNRIRSYKAVDKAQPSLFVPQRGHGGASAYGKKLRL